MNFGVLLHQFKYSFIARIWKIRITVKFSLRNCENLKAILSTAKYEIRQVSTI
jgi:hypothetical protein